MSDSMQTICSNLETPIIVVILCILAFTLFLAGTLIAEIFTTRRNMKESVPRLIDEIKRQESSPMGCIRESGLLKSQKKTLVEVAEHKEITNGMRKSMAAHLINERKARYDWIVKQSDLMIRLAPIFGCLGTLIQIGSIIVPGEEGNYILSEPILPAFGTVIFGLISAAICMVISMIRKRWYANDISVLELLMECVLEVSNQVEPEQQMQPQIQPLVKQQVQLQEQQNVSNTLEKQEEAPSRQVEQPASLPLQAFMPPGDAPDEMFTPKTEKPASQPDQPLRSYLPPEGSDSDQPLRVYLPSEDSDPEQPLRVYLSEDQTVARTMPEQLMSETEQPTAEPRTMTAPLQAVKPEEQANADQTGVAQKKLPAGFSFMPEFEQQRILQEMGAE